MLGKWLAEQILSEDNGIKRVIAIFSGRFQPMGKHHVEAFNELVAQFGAENTFIATSDKTNTKDSPLNFKEKQAVAVKHGIPEDKIIQVRNPYQSLEVLKKFPKETTAVVFMYGDKDAGRLSYTKKDGSPGYFKKYEEGMPMEPYTTRGYVVIAPHVKMNVPGFGEMSGTTIRQAMASADKQTFENVMGFYDPEIHNMFRVKFSQLVNESIERFLIEITSTAGSAIGLVDDGPRYYYGNQASYRARNKAMAERLGYSVLNYIVKDDPIEIHNTEFPDGPPLAVSYFPVGIEGARNYGTNYSKELKGRPAYREWEKYIRRVAERVGYRFIDFLDADNAIADTVKSPSKPGALTESVTVKEWWTLQIESILTEQPIPPDLLSSFNIQSNLNPVIWTKDGKLDPVVHKKLLKIAVNFFKELGLPISVKIQDIRFTGSLANYNWSKFSDIDLHIVLNFEDISTDTEFVRKYFIAKKNLWNQKHDIIIRGYPVEVYVENVDEPHTATGLYSVLTNSWIKVPSHTTVQIDKNAIKVKAKSFIDMASELEDMITRGEYEDVMSMVEEIKTKLKNMRRAGLEGAGEYSIENLAFKVLRRNGFIERINLIADKAYDLDLGEGYTKNLIESRLLTEGGASGHMNHPFDDRDLTFAEMKEIVRLALQGRLDIEEAVTEKTDGQNLNVTFKNGKVGAARNKATIKDPMTVDQVKAQFEGRGDIADAFGFAMEDLEKAILAIPEAKREEIFQNGTRFVNLEIIYPATKNVINYGSNAYLQFHGLNEFDLESGNKTGEYPKYGDMLQKMIADVNADTQEHFKIIPPNVIKMQKARDFDSREKYFIDEISKLQREFGLTDDDEVIMYHQRWWEQFIDTQFPGITPDAKEGLIRRWAYDDKSFRLNNKTITDANMLQKAIEFDKKNFAAQNKKNVYAFERIFLELGAEVLKNVTNYLAANPSAAVKELRKDIADTIKQLKSSDDIQALQKLQHELKRVESMGGFEKLVPSEGIVFVYKGKTYKLTGLFAPINQLLGIARYAR